MADPRARAQITLSRVGLLPKDAIVNVFHFEGDDEVTVDDREHWDSLAPGLATRLITFYNVCDNYFSDKLSGAAKVTIYDMADPQPRIPRHEQTFTVAHAGGGLPAEIALCLSMQGASEAGANMARRRGRVYLGPFLDNSTAALQDTTDSRPAVAMRQAILDAAVTMAQGVSGAFRLAVYSPTQDAIGTLDSSFNDVTKLWIDNAWDIQRRRGAAPTSRLEAVAS